MTKISTWITAEGEFKHAPPANGTDYALEELQKMVGGLIQILHTRWGNLLIVDEEGVLKGKTVNLAATEIAGQDIVGDAVLCDPSLVK